MNLDLVPKRTDLVATKQNPNEPFGEYVGRWHALALQVRDRPSDEESIEIVIKGAQPFTGALLSIQQVTTFAAPIQAGARVESSLRSGNFPTLSAFTKQATAHNNNSSSSNSNNSSGSSNNCPRKKDPPKIDVAYVDSPTALVHLAARPASNQVVYTL